MMKRFLALAAICAALVAAASPAKAERLTAEKLNNAEWREQAAGKGPNAVVFKAQVLLDRAGFSPGVIDARGGDNFEKALRAFQSENKIEASGKLDEATWQALVATSSDPVAETYTIAAADVKGPFVKRIPKDFRKMAKLKRLAYHSPRELLAEKFHMDEDLLKALNPKAEFDAKGESILVAHVGTSNKAANKAARLEIDKDEGSLRAFDAENKLIAFYPATVGSEEKPAPSGEFKVRGVAHNPTYHYNPDYAFKGQKARTPLTIAPGPNNPVGIVWIALTAKSYGIHGTPDPSRVSKTESHGCVRLTNWDALALSKLVKKGTPVEFKE
jgi:lipoprotein-anchoring transpeptidase ErfK/SrfK